MSIEEQINNQHKKGIPPFLKEFQDKYGKALMDFNHIISINTRAEEDKKERFTDDIDKSAR